MIILNYCNKKDFLKLLKLFNFDYSESFWKNKINIFFGNKAFQVRNFSNYKQLFIDFNSGRFCHYCCIESDFTHFDYKFGFLCENCLDEISDIGTMDCSIN